MNIYLIRHTEVYNPNKLCYGQSEIPLAENFTVHFDWIKDHLNLAGSTHYYSSPFRRCTKLAAYLSDDEFKIDKRLSELSFGKWEMTPWNAIPEKELKPWMEDFVNYKIKKGENFLDLKLRAISFFEEIKASDVENIVIMTHAGVIRSIIAHVLNFPLKNAFNLQIDYSSISKINYSPEYKTMAISCINLNADSFSCK